MRVLPILFNTDMVRAILDGRKTVTRRVLKLPKYIKIQENGLYTLFTEGTCYENQHLEDIVMYLNKPCESGDILYVRETWNEWTGGYLYKAWSGPFPQPGAFKAMKWHPSIHMPKEATRIFLKVKDVRVERLQDITCDQILREGANRDRINSYIKQLPEQNGEWFRAAYLFEWSELWDSTIKKTDFSTYGWDANPYVYVIEFEQCEKPENF